jgi:diacylglycerol O-acyltransferase / wax synthase
MEPLSGLDAAFLYLESPTSHMNVGFVAVLDGSTLAGAPAFPRVAELVEARLPLIPAFRRRLLWPRGGVLPPVWVPDRGFCLHDHLFALPPLAELADDTVAALAADVMRHPLDRRRPLWEMHVVEGREDGRVAIITKVHHAAIDGISGAELLASLVDISPEGRQVAPSHPRRGTPHGEVTAALRSGGEWLATHPLRSAQAVAATVSRLRAARPDPDALEQAPDGSPPMLPSASRTALTRPIGHRRTVTLTTLPMDDIAQVRKSLGGTVNDVVLATCAGALRSYLAGRGGGADAALAALVPVSLRSAEHAGKAGNVVSAMLVPLVTEVDDPRTRYDRIVANARAAKRREAQLRAGELVSEWVKLLGPAVGNPLGYLGSRTTRALAIAKRQLPINVIISNIPGPPLQMYAAGLPMTGVFPMGPIIDGVPLNITVLSYHDTLHVGLVACPRAVPHVDRFTGYFHQAMDELLGICQ